MLITRHRDRPGTIGRIGQLLGRADVNISAMHVARVGAARRRADGPVGRRRRQPGARGGDPRRRGRPRPVDDPARTAPVTEEGAEQPRRGERRRSGAASSRRRRSSRPASTRSSPSSATASRSGSPRAASRARATRRCPTSAGARRLLTARRIARRARRPALPLPPGAAAAIVHSPLARAAETAALIARAVSGGRGDDAVADPVPVRPEPGLTRDRPGRVGGPAERRGRRALGRAAGALAARPARPPGRPAASRSPRWTSASASRSRELLEDLADGRAARRRAPARRSSATASLPSDEPWSIVVGHDGVFKVALLALLDLPLARFWILPFALCGITIVEIRNGRPRLRLHNATDHLSSLETEAEREAAEARAQRRSALARPSAATARGAAGGGRGGGRRR